MIEEVNVVSEQYSLAGPSHTGCNKCGEVVKYEYCIGIQ